MPLNSYWGISRPANPLWNVWANDSKLLELYTKRCREQIEEMTCAKQLAELIIKYCSPEESILDIGCGGAWYYNSLRSRGYLANYYGIDYTPEMIELSSQEIGKKYLSSDHFKLMSIEDLEYTFDNMICFHVLTNVPHYMYILDRILSCTKKRLFLREYIDYNDMYLVDFRPDPYIDEDKKPINVYHNAIPYNEFQRFCLSKGFRVTEFIDERTNGKIEIVCDIPHKWRIFMIEREV